ncbi:DUF427 domain-containing protein [Mycolicibacterium palauense]|uniref:DUF427 domain-containing protein n=1 Tax=Mycolicibacterium palauense TaxID=2034511 RepID=UPI000BFF05A5|nr:DUF427 domain-containing protein [Mycolicibacterium palauense]
MAQRPVLQPSPEHPITVEETRGRVQVRVNGETVAESSRALTLRESEYPPVQYLPLDDVVHGRLAPSGHQTYCPFKGEAGYYHVTTADGAVVEDAVWTYRDPYPAVAPIAGYVAFYPGKADITIAAG